MIKFDDLPNLSLILLLTGVFFVIGLVILGSFQTNTVSSVTVVNDSFTMPAINGTITLDHYKLTSLTSIKNASGGTFASANYTVTSYADSTVKFLNNNTVCATGQTCYANYVYSSYDTAAPVAIQNTMTAMSEIPTNWLLLIVVVIAAAVIIGIVIKNLGGEATGRI